MMIIVSIATRSGMFNWIANELLKLTKGRPIGILFALGLFTAIASAFLDNVTTVILIMPVTFFIAKKHYEQILKVFRKRSRFLNNFELFCGGINDN